ncbi:hypothetical protein [Dysgonomonas sp. 25]|uniref:hypothetical protein n=1 Tax=Dysgonomonas sp. 25 TaxID=2302933 RepID=UPI0013D21354|nr:hypothetical protein [Dysgonomonas sp. 25]NDV69276.1 hypothetical protein [Dysgonomonas sp. 25]
MANNYNWKERYYDENGALIASPVYVSALGSKNGTGTKDNPLPANFRTAIEVKYVLSNGNFPDIINGTVRTNLYGSGNTEFNGTSLQSDILRITDSIISDITNYRYNQTGFYRCIIRQDFPTTIQTMSYCMVVADQPFTAANASNNSYHGINIPSLNSNMSLGLLSDCNISISQSNLNSIYWQYLGFDNCRFKIGDETDYNPLTGNTETELRQHFVDRCVAQSLTVPTGSEYGETNLPMYRWIFANNSTTGGCVIRDSIIDNFQKRRFVQLGWKQETVEPIAITTDTTSANAIGFIPSANLNVSDGSIAYKDDIDIREQHTDTLTSNIIWLGEGLQKINSINILHNLAAQYGVFIDSTPSIVPVINGQIEEGEFYLVRSADNLKASISYNGVAYTSSLEERENIFIGATDVNSWITSSGNEQVYKVKDLAILSTIKMRIVDTLPTDKITTGSLESGYWYFVEPVDVDNPAGNITYNGKQYPCFASFLSTGGTFSISGDCRLRRCWKQAFDFATETIDKFFWSSIQKPVWFDVVPHDMRCLMKNNSAKGGEMQSANNTYIATGYPGFYNMITAESGVPIPAYPITGKYMQIELVLSTLNPM